MLNENSPKVKTLRLALAAKGIASFYGGRKGHGFWLYRSTPAEATNLIEHFDPSVDFSGRCINNDGQKSGNECFWMFDDAEQLASILTRSEWEAEWKPLDPNSAENKSLGLMSYVEKGTRIKAAWHIPVRLSCNARYEVYIEGLLSEGAKIPDFIIAQIEPGANRYHDVPLVGARQKALS